MPVIWKLPSKAQFFTPNVSSIELLQFADISSFVFVRLTRQTPKTKEEIYDAAGKKTFNIYINI